MKRVLFFFTLCASIVSAQDVSLYGTVSDVSGNAIEGAIVELLDAQVKDTTDASGNYLLSGEVGIIRKNNNSSISIDNIFYRNNKFYIRSSVSSNTVIRLYDLQGVRISDVFNGTLKKGNNEIPFRLDNFGCNVFLMTIQSGEKSSSYKLISMASNTYSVFNISSQETRAGLGKNAQVDWLQVTKTGFSTHLEEIVSYIDTINITMQLPSAEPDFGGNVYVFDSDMDINTIQSQVDNVFNQQESDQMGDDRFAFLFKPGTYNLDVNVGYYTHVAGLGQLPDDVTINGAVRVEADWFGGNSTHNFWRGCENIYVNPSGDFNRWAVSQADPFRRMHIGGDLVLDDGGWASGGYIADSKIDGEIRSGSQQQWFTRTTEMGSWSGAVWNMFFIGCVNDPTPGDWSSSPYTSIDSVPLIREKPFLTIDGSGNYSVYVPELRENRTGHSWSEGMGSGEFISIDQFYIAHSDVDDETTINAALTEGKNLLFTPGIYHLNGSIEVNRPGTIIYGLGFPSLIPDAGDPQIIVSDVGGVKIAGGIMFEGSTAKPQTMLQIGEEGASADHSDNPICIYDVFCRTGGGFVGSAHSMVTINSNDVIADHFWLWRADHGTGVGWTANECANGLIVNGDNVTIYGQFNEHNQEYQCLWNGENGRNYFYQCEMPYDPPSQDAWSHDGVNGWAGYKVADNVQNHEAWGLGVYCVFHDSPSNADNAIETPTGNGISFNNMVTIKLGGSNGTILNVINGTGGEAEARLAEYP